MLVAELVAVRHQIGPQRLQIAGPARRISEGIEEQPHAGQRTTLQIERRPDFVSSPSARLRFALLFGHGAQVHDFQRQPGLR